MKHLKLFENETDEKGYSKDDVIGLLKNIRGILPWGAHTEMFEDIVKSWLKNFNYKGEHYRDHLDIEGWFKNKFST